MGQEALKFPELSGIRTIGRSPSRPGEIAVIQHVSYEGPGRISETLNASGLRVRHVETHKGDPLPEDLSSTFGLVVLGGPDVGEDTKWSPDLHQEMILIGKALDRNIPILGISLGAGLLAATLGARVYPSAYLEIGWHECVLKSAAKQDPMFRGEGERFHAFHWHGDVFDLPRGAVELASGGLDGNHGFRWGDSAYGLRFHLEMTALQIMALVDAFLLGDPVLEGEAEAIVAGFGLHGPGLRELGGRVLGRWVEQVKSRSDR